MFEVVKSSQTLERDILEGVVALELTKIASQTHSWHGYAFPERPITQGCKIQAYLCTYQRAILQIQISVLAEQITKFD